MDFEFTDDQLELRESARQVLASACPPSLVRAVFEGKGDGADLQDTLVGLDWAGLGLPEEHGGLGLGVVEVGIVVEELGRVVAPSPLLATLTQLVPLVREAGSGFRLAEVATGACTGTLALAEGGQWSLGAVRTTARRRDGGWVLDGVKTHVVDGATASEVAVVARSDAGLGAFVVPGSSVEAVPLQSIDPTLPIATVTLRDVEVDGDRVLVEPGDPSAERT